MSAFPELNLSQKLLDETTSRVVCASPLLYNEGYGGAMLSSQSSFTVSTSSISSMMGGMLDKGVVIFITHQCGNVRREAAFLSDLLFLILLLLSVCLHFLFL